MRPTRGRRRSWTRPRPSCAKTKSPSTLGGHDLERIGETSLLVASPGVPPDAPPIVAARRAGVPVVSEIEIGLRFLPRLRYIAITGTNGKTTTTALTGHLLRCVGRRAVTAGNIGTPLTELALSPYAAGLGGARAVVVPAARHAERQSARRRFSRTCRRTISTDTPASTSTSATRR